MYSAGTKVVSVEADSTHYSMRHTCLILSCSVLRDESHGNERPLSFA
jgi:hypothetical protein